jgi:hypothetical protein
MQFRWEMWHDGRLALVWVPAVGSRVRSSQPGAATVCQFQLIVLFYCYSQFCFG